MKRERGTGGAYKKRAGGGSTWGGKTKRERKEKPCPAFKKINGTNIIVDGFQYKSYSITAKLMFIKLGVSPNYVRPLSMFTPHMVEGTEVTLLPANHCPGAVLLLFKVDGRYILHVGDFRYHPNMQSYDELRRNEIHKRVVELVLREKRESTLFLVGTYCIGKEEVFCGIARTDQSVRDPR
ncbi:uncharacterized protein ACA1_263970 [Acanthamoeba castellanii str. Neff]|uniref:Metallo-beta-lactamase domain-containing protein n=1 Tax=Acanthamoeba castellanii (strain ATCC 30010 / Neff) TaxID=1257118 RepID=L8H1Z1_ACACF|nr:uncharacterized protein ACA1_263970 [Acanthamoeba castellanii str. Neff]ELR19227.1 hypothetical protein ACA1_263970 [Acanthamoeba castellanii str. Neff]